LLAQANRTAAPRTPTEDEPSKKQFKKGDCYYCQKPGHFAFECPDKPDKVGKGKGKGKKGKGK